MPTTNTALKERIPRQSGPMRVDCQALVQIAREKEWGATRLAQCFDDMPLSVAILLLWGDLDITPEGTTHAVHA